MAASKAKRRRYEVTNWRAYNASLVRRGDITIWFSSEVLDAWEHDNAEARRGHPFLYSDLAIETLLTLRELFRLPYRQTEGLGRALVKLMGVGVTIPHHTSLVKRAAKLAINTQLADAKGPIDVVVDSTGLKVYGDGAYDTWPLREHLAEEEIHQIIPPRSGAVIRQHGNSKNDPIERDECVRQIRREGKKAWKESIGYHRRSLGETAMSRLKTTFGDRLKNREPPNQVTEVALRTKILNAFAAIGMPLSLWI